MKQRFHWPGVNWFALGSSLSFASVGIDTFIARVGFVKTRNGSAFCATLRSMEHVIKVCVVIWPIANIPVDASRINSGG